MPILGIIASQNYPRVTNSYESIATANGTGSSGTVTFSSIPSTYQHLQIRAIVKNSSSASYANMRFNSDSATNYNNHYLDGSGASVTAGANVSDDKLYFGYTTISTDTNTFGVMVVDILDYANTNKNKTIRSLNGRDTNGSGYIELASGAWRNTNAVTDISIFMANNFTTGSTFALYGIKG
jgi:hypothetical protein